MCGRPTSAPNVLVILIDDVGFGASSAFGGPCETPNFEKLASGGLEVHPVAHHRAVLADAAGACSPAATTTRSAWATSPRPPPRHPATPRCCRTPRRRWPLTLKLNGYSTAQFGKCHEVPVWQTSPAGPFTAWPTGGGGFEYFYGFIGGENNQWDPALYEGTTPDRAAEDPGRGLSPDRGSDRQGDQLGAPAEGAAARQAVLHVLRARRHPRAAPRAQGVDRQVQGQVRARLGPPARDHLRAAEGTGRHRRPTRC